MQIEGTKCCNKDNLQHVSSSRTYIDTYVCLIHNVHFTTKV